MALGGLLIGIGFVSGLKFRSQTITFSTTSPFASASSTSSLEFLKVTRVVDGDTIDVEGGKRIRLIGIDTPEINRTGATACFGIEAKDYAEKLLNGQMVKLEKDVSEVDRYNRLLRYVYLGDIMINDKLVRDGYARVYTYPPDVKYNDKFLESERFARENSLGLWTKCSDTTLIHINIVSPSPQSSSSSVNQFSSINCSSNSYNCSSFKTQSEAQNVFDYCMKQVGYDVHKLDRDGDGKVCETLP